MAFTVENAPWKLPAEAVRCIDGDTVVFLARAQLKMPGQLVTVEREFVVRLLETDTPERGDAGWSEATAFAKGFLFNGSFSPPEPRPAELRLTGKRDVYGRFLGWAFVDGVNLSYALNDAGHGKYTSAYRQIEKLEAPEL